MFRIESYVTPIILSYVEKYVKNIRPQDSQMSLWGGEVSFQNLDLRLDVLEEELNLPFCFLSGHIHELTIRVPWTKIASEPICVTINTIEFVLKLKDPQHGSPTAARSGQSAAAKKKKISKYEEPPTSPTGYMASLVNKIANNISIQCHNIIFKYVEEDLVISMAIQLLSLNSADLNWSPAFVDISPTKVILRKIIEISNLTICLDKRNEIGKIEMCQEPILYRCSMKLHMLRRYNAPTSHRASLFRVDLKSDAMHINISSVQFPMVMRLFNLLQALKDGSLEKRLRLQQLQMSGQEGGSGGGTGDTNENANVDDEGFISWAWNLLPTIFPEDTASESSDDINEHITHFGFEIDDIQVTVKDQEAMQSTDTSTTNTKKAKYRPLFRLQFQGCHGTSIGIGRRWSTFQGSVNKMQMVPFEKCICGKSQSIEYFIKSQDDDGNNVKPDTLELRESELYTADWDQYYVLRSEATLRKQKEALVFDICYTLEVPDDISTRLSEVGSDLEQSGLRERHWMRVYCNNLQFKWGPSVSHLVDTIKGYAQDYNYPPYLPVKPIPPFNQLTPPSSDDYEALMAEVPLRKYDVAMRGTRIEFEFTDHKLAAEQKRLHGAGRLCCNLDAIEVSYVTPFYPNRLVFTTCQLPQWPMKLFEACYQRTNVKLSGIEVVLGETKVGQIPEFTGYSREIIHPSLWLDPNVLSKDTEVNVGVLEVRNVDQRIISAINAILYGAQMDCCDLKETTKSSPAEISLKFQELKFIKFETRLTKVQQLKVQHISGEVAQGINQTQFLQSKVYKDSGNVVDFLLQTPLDADEVNPAIIMANLGEMLLICNNDLIELINIIEKVPRDNKLQRKISSVADDAKSVLTKQSGNKDRPALSRRSGSVALESVHSSSEKNTTVVMPNLTTEETVNVPGSFNLGDLFQQYKTKIISCDIKGPTVCLDFTASKCTQKIKLPDIIMTTAGGRVGELKRKVPISNEALDIVDKKRFFFPWSFQFIDFSCEIESSGHVFSVLESIKSNVTLLVNEKALEEGGSIIDPNTSSLEIVLHVDTTPIVVNLSEIAVNFLHLNWKTIDGLKIFKQRPMTAVPPEQDAHIEIAKRPISPDSSFDLKKLFDSSATVDTKERDDSGTDVTEIPKETNSETSPSIWMQWAFEKFHVNLFCNADTEKLSMKAEDVICSLDQKEAYTKIKTKVGSVSGKLMTLSTQDGNWNPEESLSFMGCNKEPSNVAFVDLTVTRARTGIVHSKWGVKKKHRYMNNSLIEVMLKMQNLEAKVDICQVEKFISVFDGVRGSPRKPEGFVSKQQDTVTSVADLPLVFFESKGIQLYLPTSEKNKMAGSSSHVFIFKVNEISINPTVENPLTRNPVRADIYTKASQLGILNLPGSKIEDRQYEVQLKQMSVESADWNEMQCYMNSIGNGYENPAVAWNNPTKDKTLEICEVFKDFQCNIVWAPAIVFNNVLVCGPSIELSCVSDLNLKVRMDQFDALTGLKESLDSISARKVNRKSLINIARLFKDNNFYNELKKSTKLNKPPKAMKVIMSSSATGNHDFNDSRTEKGSRKSDSGISSMRVPRKTSKVSMITDYKMNIPYDMTFLGGNFYINLYDKMEKTRNTDDEDAKLVPAIPIAKLLLYQPNFTLTQSVYDRTVNMGIFNITIQLPDEDNTDEVFNSHQGKLNALGIPPSVIKLKFTESVTKERMLTVNLFRPMRLKTSQRILQKLNTLSRFLSNNSTSPSVDEAPKTVPSEWIEKARERFFNSTKLSFSITQLECIYDHQKLEPHKLNLIISQLSTNCLIQAEKMTVEMLVKGVSLRTNELTLLHPASLSATIVLVKEFWQKNPVITISGGCNFLQLDVGPKSVICIKEISDSLLNQTAKETTNHGVSPLDCHNRINHDRIRLGTPKISTEVNEEYYQDDLRAGAFQFVEISSDRTLPLPYQIQVINRRDNRIICWKYPQARALHNVEILPVPFNIVTAAVVKCYMEYYSESRGEFMSYSEFSLSESHRQILKLPKQVTARVWRVVMRTPTVLVDGKLFEDESSSIEDDLGTKVYNINDILQTAEDDDSGMEGGSVADNILTLHPKILIACMKVDSFFNPTLIPNCNVYFHVNHLEVNIMNQLVASDEFSLPKVLKNFKGPCNVLPLNQHVAQIRIDNLKLGANIFDDLNLDVQWEFGFEMNLVDYAYLRLMPFIEHFRFNGYYDYDEKRHLLNLLIHNSMKIRQSPSVVHTINTMMAIWTQSLSSTGHASRELIMMTRFTICNSTSAVIYYGQQESADLYPILPKGFDFYAFRSVNAEQALDFAIDGESGRVRATGCRIGEDGEQYLRLGSSFLVVTIKSISSTQRMITVRGQMEILNLSREKFVIEIGAEEERKPLMLLDKSVSIVCQKSLEELNVLRICFESIGHWSGDIPIRPSGKRLPWLVKVPVAKNKYLSYWLRIVKCPCLVDGQEFSRIVVIVLPLYLVRSYLPKDTIVEELKLQKTCQVFGKGALNELHFMGTHDDEHNLKFNENFRTSMGHDRSEILLSYKAMDVAKLFPAVEEQIPDVSRLIGAFESFSYDAKQWPIDEECEMRIKRLISEPDHFVPLCDFGSMMNTEEKLFNSLVLEIAPWCIFINSSGMRVYVKNNDRVMGIDANHLGTPFDFVDNKFTLQFDAGDETYLETGEIHLTSAGQSSKKELSLVDDEALPLEVSNESGRYLLKFILSSRRVKNRRILTLATQYVAVNYTSFELSLFAITVPVATDKNMFFSKGLFPSPEIGSYKLEGVMEESARAGSIKGIALPMVNNEFMLTKKKPKKEPPKLQYLIIATKEAADDDNLCPINITEAFTRKTVNIPGKIKATSLIVSMIKERDQFMITVIEDPSADILFHNKTEYNLCIAQSESTTKLVGPVKECDHFQWFQILPGKCLMNYSPPLIYKNYPQLTMTSCGITLAVTTMEGSQLKWSQPFAVLDSGSGEFYLALPGRNDVKVIINADRRTTRVTLDTVNTSQEFSLRNVRSRLLHPIAEEQEEGVDVNSSSCALVAEESIMEPTVTEPLKLQLTLFVREVGLFVATESKDQCWTKTDIVSLTVDDLLIEYDSDKRRLRLEMGNIQIDNQLAHTNGNFDFPVVFCADSEISLRDIPSTAVFYLHEIVKAQPASPLMTLLIKLYAQEMEIEELECTVRPIRLYLEDTYLSTLGDAVTEFMPQNAVYSSDVSSDQEVKEMLSNGSQVIIPRHIEKITRGLCRPLKMKMFKVGNVDVLISLHTSTRFYIALDHSPLSFSAFERSNLRTTELKLGSSMSMHYLSGAIFGAGWMVGSLEFLGSPSGLARSVTTGLKDFVSMPVEGLFKGPWEFMLGVTTGSLSLVRNITAGTVNSVTKLATSVARNLDRLTLDAEHVQRTDSVRRYKPLGVAEGFSQGLTQFGITLLGAIGGISRHTMAARTPGQVLSGVGKGLMGVILKPISGAAELVAYTGNGVLHSVGYNTLPSCRSLSVSQGVLSPSQCHLSWKVLQPILDTNQILFTQIVTLMQENALVPSFLGFSETVVITLNLSTDEVAIYPMAVVHPQIDANDPTVVQLRIVSKIPPTEDNEQFLNFHHIASRVREYIQSSREHLPMCGAAAEAGTYDVAPDIPIVEGFVVDRTVSFYVQSDVAQHIVDYMMFLKYYNHEKYAL